VKSETISLKLSINYLMDTTIQVKTDEKAAITGNAFLETISADSSGGCQEKQGWIFTVKHERQRWL